MIQVLTVTGMRPQALALCAQYMARQTVGTGVRWVVVDDGVAETPLPAPTGWSISRVRPDSLWREGVNTQHSNLLAGMAQVDPALPLVIVEDDDWYAPDWLEWCAAQLQRADLVGEGRARYYSVSKRVGKQLANTRHASLCATAMNPCVFPAFTSAIRSGETFIDLRLWQAWSAAGRRKYLELNDHRTVGVKGMPGRTGIGMGHKDSFSGQRDPSLGLLRQWVGADADLYLPYVGCL